MIQNYYKSYMPTCTISCLTSKLHILTFHTDKSECVISQEMADVARSFKIGRLGKWSYQIYMNIVICNEYLQIVEISDTLVALNSLI